MLKLPHGGWLLVVHRLRVANMKTAAAAVLFVVLLFAAVEAATLPAKASENLQKSEGLLLVEKPNGSYAANDSDSTARHAIKATTVGNVVSATDGAAGGSSSAIVSANSKVAASVDKSYLNSIAWGAHAVDNTSSDAAGNASATAKHPFESFDVKAFIDGVSKLLGSRFNANTSIENASKRLGFEDDAAALITSPVVKMIADSLRGVLNDLQANAAFFNARDDVGNSLGTNALTNAVSQLFGSADDQTGNGDSSENSFGAAISTLLGRYKSNEAPMGDDSGFGLNADRLENIFGNLFLPDVGADSRTSGERSFNFPVSVQSDLVGQLNGGSFLSSSSSSNTASDSLGPDANDLGSALSGVFDSGTGEYGSTGLGSGVFGDILSLLGSGANAAGSSISSRLTDDVTDSKEDDADNSFPSAAYSTQCTINSAYCGVENTLGNLFGSDVGGLDIANAE